jgi:transposase
MMSQPVEEEASMTEVSIVGVDLAKQAFQLHAAARDGSVVFRRKLSRSKFVEAMAKLPRCVVAMEACATAHYWGRVLGAQGHEVRLIPPVYVKPFVKRQKNDAADAEAIVEAAQHADGRSLSNPSISRRAPCYSARGKC